MLKISINYNENYVDLTDGKVTDEFIKSTHEKYKDHFYKYFGNVITSLFTDEPQYSSFEHFNYVFGSCFQDYYKEQYGKDIKEELWKLYAPQFDNNEFCKKYLLMASNLFKENYINKVAKWCDENNLLFTGHLSAEDGIVSESLGSGGVMYDYTSMSMPGIDFLGKRFTSPVLLKQLESVKNQQKKPLVLSESFGCAGWGCFLTDYSEIWDYQTAFGINKLCAHLSAYSIEGVRKRDYPGFFSYQQPWFNKAKPFFDRFKKYTKLLFNSFPKNKIAIIHPILNALGENPNGQKQRFISCNFRLLTEILISLQIGFDYVDERTLQESGFAKNNELYLGECEYDLIMCLGGVIQNSTYELLNGLEVVSFLGTVYSPQNQQLKTVEIPLNREAISDFFESRKYKYELKILNNDYKIASGIVTNIFYRNDEVYYFVLNRTDRSQELILESSYSTITELIDDTYCNVKLLKKENNYYAHMSFQAGESKIFSPTHAIEQNYLSCDKFEYLQPINSFISEKNTLTIDKASISYNGIDYCCYKDITLIQKDLFSSGKSGKVYIKYQFKDFREIKNTLQLCMEVSGAKAIYVNGVMPKILDNEWFIDKSIKVFSLENVPIKTDNEIVVEYYIPEFNSDITGKFETVRNLFHYPIEPECIYIRGEFGVSFNGDYVDKTEYISCSGDFCLDSIKVIEDISNITPSSLWFYRGSLFVDYEFYGDDYTCLTVEDISSNGVLLTINGIEKFVFTKGQKIILNGLLNPGINKIRAEYLGTNRNTLGAFHHYAGEPKMTGRNTFEGIKGFEDFVNHDAKDITFTEKYNFIKFGAGKIKLFKL